MTATQTVAPKPRRNVPISVADYISQQVNLCGKSQQQVATEAGFNKPNIITMIKQGRTKLPLAKVGPMAHSLGVDPVYLFRLVMQEYDPDTWQAIEEHILQQPVLTENELDIIATIRCSNVPNPKLRNDDERQRLLEVVGTLKPDGAE
jgi:transcriptional regulator with XRE-family HTH domain